MSWLRTAFSISTPEQDSYYTVVHPVDFYEWKYNNSVPKNTVFTKHLPPSDIFMDGHIVASSVIPSDNLSKKSTSYSLKEDTNIDIVLKIGQMPTAQELVDKYHTSIESFNRGLSLFKEDVLTRLYITSGDRSHLFRIANYNEDEVTFHNFGEIKELTEKFAEIREAILDDSMTRKGRAYEMEEFRRYESAMTFINNSHLHVDASKMDRLLESSGVKSNMMKTSSWRDCYLEMSDGAKILNEDIEKFLSQKWMKRITS